MVLPKEVKKKTNEKIEKNEKIENNEKIEKKQLTKEELEKKIEGLEKKLKLLEEKQWSNYIDEYIDTWYEENKDEVDIGRIKLFNLIPIDVMPDELEKHIYKKVFKIMYSLLKHKL
tara:strand:- start:1360 stop:1707 length:348 start_codon:yes stop_codon:yes gene_type:complete